MTKMSAECSIKDLNGWQVGFSNGWYVWDSRSNLSKGRPSLEAALREAFEAGAGNRARGKTLADLRRYVATAPMKDPLTMIDEFESGQDACPHVLTTMLRTHRCRLPKGHAGHIHQGDSYWDDSLEPARVEHFSWPGALSDLSSGKERPGAS